MPVKKAFIKSWLFDQSNQVYFATQFSTEAKANKQII